MHTRLTLLLAKDLARNNDTENIHARVQEIIDPDINCNDVLKKHFAIQPIEDITEMSDSTLTDMQLDEWCRKIGHTIGGRDLLHRMLSAPTTNIQLLKKRQDSIKKTDALWVENVKELAKLEKEMLWIYTLPETITDAWPIPLLFPSLPILRRINQSEKGMSIYHAYRIWLTPVLQLLIPTMSILGPWFYLRYRMKLNIKLSEYFQFIRLMFVQSMAGINWKERISKYGTIFVYIFVFLYGFVQTIDISRMLYSVKQQLIDRSRKIRAFIDGAHDLVSQWGIEIIEKPHIPNGMAGIYAIWTDKQLRSNIRILMQRFYELDVSLNCKLLISKEGWSYTRYKKPESGTNILIRMRNPLLGKKQVNNPVCLSKNVIITGPNAAGKSTYVRSIGANIICAQTLGICYANKAIISPLHAIMSYMRIRDIVGDKSLFETEVSHCSDIIRKAEEIQKSGKHALIFFDEPMHSTPAIEGEAAAYAVLEHLGNLKSVRTIVTSHYHRITSLGSCLDKDGNNISQWANLCMDAIKDTNKKGYSFPYRIRSGASFQSIALELLQDTDKLPISIVQNAIKFKSSINKQ